MSTVVLIRWFVIMACSSPFALAGDVRIVDAIGSPSFPDIQSAVNAASEGDVLLIGAGNYAAFTIDGKDLTLIAAPNETVAVQGTIDIKNLSGQNVVLSRLSTTSTGNQPALRLQNSAGQVRAQSCFFACIPNVPYTGGGAGASIDGSDAAFTNCIFRGGQGAETIDVTAQSGGAGVLAYSSRVALYDCQSIGGKGGYSDGGSGGTGGSGFGGSAFYLFASATSFQGGAGGNSYDYWNTGTQGGDGGVGLAAAAATQVDLLSNTYTGGAGGYEYHFGSWGLPGTPYSVPAGTNWHAGNPRRFSAPVMVSDQTNLSVTVTGQAGDRVYLMRGTGFTFAPAAPARGAWLVAGPMFAKAEPLAILPISGTLQVPLPNVQFPLAVERFAYQGLIVDSNGQIFLANSFHLALVNRDSPPDCNANGVSDFIDLLALGADCNDDLELDACQIASGALPDCNSNQVPDGCDIASGASHDFNGNGVPDECEPTVTWYVDGAAPSGGNGSASAPFNTIAQGIVSALNGHTVLVANGTYTGAGNRNLDFGGRDIVVRSANGPATCTIDCQNSGRGFFFHNGETPAARLEGFAIRGGSTYDVWGGGGIGVLNCSPTISNCAISQCSALGTYGGGLSLYWSSSLVEKCSIVSNAAYPASNGGGGVWITSSDTGSVRLSKCLIEGNTTPGKGGGIIVRQNAISQAAILSHCTIRGNTAGGDGGGVYNGFDNGGDLLRLDDCLIVGNAASRGAGFAGRGHVTIANTTIVDNRATVSGGGVCASNGGPCSIVDSILWGNSAPLGTQASAFDLGTTLFIGYSDLLGGQSAVSINAPATLTWSAGNIASNPRFVDPDGADNDPLTFGDNDYRLTPQSRCVDAGDNALAAADWLDLDGDGNKTEPVPFDLDLLPRFVDVPAIPDTGNGTPPLIDMGAYELP